MLVAYRLLSFLVFMGLVGGCVPEEEEFHRSTHALEKESGKVVSRDSRWVRSEFYVASVLHILEDAFAEGHVAKAPPCLLLGLQDAIVSPVIIDKTGGRRSVCQIAERSCIDVGDDLLWPAAGSCNKRLGALSCGDDGDCVSDPQDPCEGRCFCEFDGRNECMCLTPVSNNERFLCRP
jgi:hypothetical protein